MNRRSEQAVILPLLAVSVFAILAIVGYLSYRPRVHKIASSALREATADLCRNLAANSLFPAEIEQLFQAEIAALQGSTALKDAMLIEDIEFAALTLPTMPDGQSTFQLSNQCTAFSGNSLPNLATATPGTYPLPGCGIPSSQCTLTTNPCLAKANTPPQNWRFPQEFFRNYLHAGNTIGCEIRARVKNVIDYLSPSANRTVTARVAYWRPVEGFSYAPYLAAGSPDNAGHAVTIIVAPQAQTPDTFVGGNSRFSMSSAPAINFTPFSPQGFPTTQLDPVGKGAFNAPPITKLGGGAILYHDYDNPNFTASPNVRNILMHTCQNRPILVRNELLRSLASLFQRNGTARSHIIALMAATQHRHRPRASPDHRFMADRLNYPVLLAARTFDSTLRVWPAPSNFLYAGVDNTDPDYLIPSNFLAGTSIAAFGQYSVADDRRPQGWIQPFTESTNPIHGHTDDRLDYMSTVASQGAACFHLYATGNGIPYDPRRSVIDYQLRNFSPTFGSLEGAEYGYRPTSNPAYMRIGNALTETRWHQACYNSILDINPALGFSEHLCQGGNQEGMNLHELFSTLGVFQQCSTNTNFGDSLIGQCNNVDPMYDYRGDLVASLYAATWNQIASVGYDRDGDGVGAGPTAIAQVVPKFSPGIGPIRQLPNWSLTNANQRPLSPENYLDGPNTGFTAPVWQAISGPIILVTHKPLFEAERDQLTRMVAALNAVGRRVILIYMPFHPAASFAAPYNNMNRVLQDFRTVLNLVGNGNSINEFKALTPEHPTMTGLYTGNANQIYQAYWRDLLLPDPNLAGLSPSSQLQTNIWEIARLIYDKVVLHEAKL